MMKFWNAVFNIPTIYSDFGQFLAALADHSSTEVKAVGLIGTNDKVKPRSFVTFSQYHYGLILRSTDSEGNVLEYHEPILAQVDFVGGIHGSTERLQMELSVLIRIARLAERIRAGGEIKVSGLSFESDLACDQRLLYLVARDYGLQEESEANDE